MNNIILWREKIFFKVGKFYVLGNILTRQVYDCIILSRITDQKMKAAGKPIKKESNSFRNKKMFIVQCGILALQDIMTS